MSFVSSHSIIIYFVPHEDNKVPQQVDQLAQSSYQSKEKCDHDIMTSPSTPSCHTNNLTNNHLLGCFYDMMVWKGTSLYVDHLSLLIDRLWRLIHLLRTLIVLIQNKNNMITEWLDTKAIGSTVFVSFGNEYFLSSSDLEEIALGLEESLDSAKRSDDNTHSSVKEPSPRQSECSSISELCGRAFSDILKSDKYSELCGLLLKNFGVVNANQVLDLNAVNLKMNNGAYETSPMLYLKG
ncbi:hypothetical protein Tco_0063989 [Tanacetum coccineum]